VDDKKIATRVRVMSWICGHILDVKVVLQIISHMFLKNSTGLSFPLFFVLFYFCFFCKLIHFYILVFSCLVHEVYYLSIAWHACLI